MSPHLFRALGATALLLALVLGTSPLLAAGAGTTLSWGANESGQVGVAPGAPITLAGESNGLTGVRAIAAGGRHTLALLEDGTVRSWGANDLGQLGNGTVEPSSTPVTVVDLANVVAISAGAAHNLAITTDGSVFAWGDGSSGQLGNGYPGVVYDSEEGCTILLIFPCLDSSGTGPSDPDETPILTRPRPVRTGSGPLREVVSVAAGGAHSLAVKADGSVWGWGSDAQGQLGAGAIAFANGPLFPLPLPVGANTSREDRLGGIVSVAAGEAHSLALAEDGALYAWGSNSSGQLGFDSEAEGLQLQPGLVPLGKVTALSAGAAHSLAIANGLVFAWGDNSHGQLGDGTTTARQAPGHVSAVPSGGGFGGSSAISVAAGAHHSLALLDRAPVDVCGSPTSLFGCPGVIYAWGAGDRGQLGGGGLSDSSLPRRVADLTDASAVSAGGGHSVALDANVGSRLIFPVEPTATIAIAPGRPTLPPLIVPTNTPTPSSAGPFIPFATPTPRP
jgi:alpha-tubulin suppressor-like RCC1 family protein